MWNGVTWIHSSVFLYRARNFDRITDRRLIGPPSSLVEPGVVSWAHIWDHESSEASLASSLTLRGCRFMTTITASISTSSGTTLLLPPLPVLYLCQQRYMISLDVAPLLVRRPWPRNKTTLSLCRIYVPESSSYRYSSSICIPQHVSSVPLAFPGAYLPRRSVDGYFT